MHTHTHAQRNSKKKGTNENPIFDWLYYVLLCLYLFSVFSSLYLYYYSRLIQKSVIKREESADFLTHITARHFNNTNRHFPTFCPVFSRNKTKRKKKQNCITNKSPNELKRRWLQFQIVSVMMEWNNGRAPPGCYVVIYSDDFGMPDRIWMRTWSVWPPPEDTKGNGAMWLHHSSPSEEKKTWKYPESNHWFSRFLLNETKNNRGKMMTSEFHILYAGEFRVACQQLRYV